MGGFICIITDRHWGWFLLSNLKAAFFSIDYPGTFQGVSNEIKGCALHHRIIMSHVQPERRKRWTFGTNGETKFSCCHRVSFRCFFSPVRKPRYLDQLSARLILASSLVGWQHFITEGRVPKYFGSLLERSWTGDVLVGDDESMS